MVRPALNAGGAGQARTTVDDLMSSWGIAERPKPGDVVLVVSELVTMRSGTGPTGSDSG
jgi:hypothetical protein